MLINTIKIANINNEGIKDTIYFRICFKFLPKFILSHILNNIDTHIGDLERLIRQLIDDSTNHIINHIYVSVDKYERYCNINIINYINLVVFYK